MLVLDDDKHLGRCVLRNCRIVAIIAQRVGGGNRIYKSNDNRINTVSNLSRSLWKCPFDVFFRSFISPYFRLDITRAFLFIGDCLLIMAN